MENGNQEHQDSNQEENNRENKNSRNSRQLIMIAIVLIVLLGGGTRLYNWMQDKEIVAADEITGQLQPRSGQMTETQTAGDDATAEEELILAPDFSVEDVEGNIVSLSGLQGKPVVLNFWASWCPPCKQEMPEFNKVYEEMGAEVHFMMIDAVDGHRETLDTGSEYVAEQGFTFPVYYDIGQSVIIQYGVRVFPSTVFIDAEGCVVAVYEGVMDEDMLRQGIALSSEKV